MILVFIHILFIHILHSNAVKCCKKKSAHFLCTWHLVAT